MEVVEIKNEQSVDGEQSGGEQPNGGEQESTIRDQHLKSIVESLVFVADKPVPLKKLARITKAAKEDIVVFLTELQEEYADRGVRLVEVGSGFQFRTAAVNAPFVRDFVSARPVRLTRAQLETLSIASYRQPLTRPELEEIRGVDSGSALKVLLDRGLLRILGRKDEPGRPLLYGTTPLFLDFFGLKSLAELPTLQEFSELSDESKELFAQKMGEPLDLEKVAEAARAADAEREEIGWSDELEEEESEREDDEEDSEEREAEEEDSNERHDEDEDEDDEDDEDDE